MITATPLFLDWDKPHVLEDLHHQLPDPLIVINPSDHLDTDLRYLGVVGELEADVLQYLDDSLPDADPGVKNPLQQHLVILVNQVSVVHHELAQQIHGSLPHHGGVVMDGAVDTLLHIISAENTGVLVHHCGHTLESSAPHLDTR